MADQAFLRAVFGPHPYGHPPYGLSRAIEQTQLEEIVRLHASAYLPWQATLIVVGAMAHDDAARAVERAFGGWPSGRPRPGQPFEEPVSSHTPAPAASRILLVDRPGAAQTELRIGHLAPPRRTPDYHKLVLLNAVLGGQFVSRINSNLREKKGYTYGAHTAFDFRREAGSFVLQTSVQTDATADAVQQCISEIGSIRRERPPTEQELDLARASLTRGFPRGFETTAQIARALAQLAIYDLPDDTFEIFTPSVLALQASDLLRAARAYLDPAGLIIVAVGDREKIAGGLGELGRGDPLITHVDM